MWPGLGHGPGDHAHQELGLVDAQIVGAHPLPGGQQRAVEYAGAGVLHRGLHGRRQHHRGGGEDQGVVLVDQLLDLGLVLVGVGAHPGGADHLGAQGVFEIDAAQVVPVDPAGLLRLLAVEEGHLHEGGAEQRGHQALALLHGGGLEHQLHVLVVLVLLELAPQRGDLALDLPVELPGRVGVADGLQVDQEGVAGGEGQAAAALPVLVGRPEAHVGRLEVVPLLAGPLHAGGVARQRVQLREGAGLGEPQVVDARVGVEGQKLEVHPVLRVVRARGHDPGDVRLDGHGVQKLHDAGPLVALHQVELVQVFIGLHRLAHAVGHHRVVQGGPLLGKLAALVQQGHEVGREGVGAALGHRAHHLVDGHLLNAQRLPGERVQLPLQLLQHRQEGVLPLLHPRVVFLQRQLSGLGVYIFAHAQSILLIVYCA